MCLGTDFAKPFVIFLLTRELRRPGAFGGDGDPISTIRNFRACPVGSVVGADERSDRRRWWTFDGLTANALLAAMLQKKYGVIPRFDNYFVEILGTSGMMETEKLLDAVRVSGCLGHGHCRRSARQDQILECLPCGLKA